MLRRTNQNVCQSKVKSLIELFVGQKIMHFSYCGEIKFTFFYQLRPTAVFRFLEIDTRSFEIRHFIKKITSTYQNNKLKNWLPKLLTLLVTFSLS